MDDKIKKALDELDENLVDKTPSSDLFADMINEFDEKRKKRQMVEFVLFLIIAPMILGLMYAAFRLNILLFLGVQLISIFFIIVYTINERKKRYETSL